ncbi:hypothetical protein K1719_012420 [Acacia pycnantha]|nr:hypothetical protein K1719_012420 [Acacia pycnantha]
MHVKSQWSSTFPLWQSRISCEEEVSAQELIDQMKEWLCEEKEISPALSEEQKTLLDSLPKLSMSDERLMDLCRPWKDALILTVLGKSVNLVMMKDRIDWILRSKSFELIDLPNNYFLFKTGNSDLRLRLLFDGPWVIQGHYLAVQRNIIGKALKVDVNTLAQCNNRNMMVERGKFVRVSVEVDLNQPLKSRMRRIVPIRKVRIALESQKLLQLHGEGKRVRPYLLLRKELLSLERDKPVIGSSKLVKSPIVSSECGTKEVVVEKEPLNLDTDGKCPLVIGEPRLEPSSERELKEQVAEVKEREHTTINVYVDQPVILKQTTHDYNLRPNGLPSMRNKKKATRDHSVIFGSTKTIESSKAVEPKVQCREEEEL